MYRPIRRNKMGTPSIENYQLWCLFVHNLGIEDTAANGVRCSTLARPVHVRSVYTSIHTSVASSWLLPYSPLSGDTLAKYRQIATEFVHVKSLKEIGGDSKLVQDFVFTLISRKGKCLGKFQAILGLNKKT